jgi:hypothetical protein
MSGNEWIGMTRIHTLKKITGLAASIRTGRVDEVSSPSRACVVVQGYCGGISVHQMAVHRRRLGTPV